MKSICIDILTDFYANTDQRFVDASPHERAITFARAFSGITLEIPVMPLVERASRDRSIVETLTADPAKERCVFLAERFGIERRSVAKIFQKHSSTNLKKHRSKLAADAAEKESEKKEVV